LASDDSLTVCTIIMDTKRLKCKYAQIRPILHFCIPRESHMRKQRHDADHLINCPMEATLDLIGGKWKSVILFRLSEGTKRFSELGRLLPRITPRMLTQQLRDMERDGLVKRTVYAEVPPRVEYALTDSGRTLQPVLDTLKAWGEKQGLPLVQNRASAD